MEDDKVVITVIGIDRPGIVAAVSSILAEANINIEDMRSTILQSEQPLFTMMLMANMENSTISFSELKKRLENIQEKMGVMILAYKEEIFRFMHRV
ncbi:MAG: ACT domain-containing protein [Candidatus Odinarchaeia archaeon]